MILHQKSNQKMLGQPVEIISTSFKGHQGMVIKTEPRRCVVLLSDMKFSAWFDNEDLKELPIDEQHINYCIFEERYCQYARRQNTIFNCTAPRDDLMNCR